MPAAEVVRLVELLESGGVGVWLDGGWGVDALLERQTREHDDSELTPEVQLLVHDGYELEEKDYRELRLLHERFGVELPIRYAARALATR
jgi:lincosamide nucleotidyltransferase A/C/D/E